jgi:hypothetical protein
MSYLIERLDRFGDAIWYFPGGIVAMIAVYLILTHTGRKRPEAVVAETPASPQSGRLGCVWTLLAVYIVVWLFLILRD